MKGKKPFIFDLALPISLKRHLSPFSCYSLQLLFFFHFLSHFLFHNPFSYPFLPFLSLPPFSFLIRRKNTALSRRSSAALALVALSLRSDSLSSTTRTERLSETSSYYFLSHFFPTLSFLFFPLLSLRSLFI